MNVQEKPKKNVEEYIKEKNAQNIVNKIIHTDVLDGLARIPDNLVDLVVTSCPYNVGIKYSQHQDQMTHEDYLNWMEKVWGECYRVLRPGGRLCVNIDMTANMGDRSKEYYRPLYADFVNMNRKNNFMFRTEIAWYKQNLVGSATAWGCYDEKTRVLTREGFKNFEHIDIKNDEFATLNIETNNVEWQKGSKKFCYDYEGEMYDLKSKDFDLKVTPNHNMLLRNNYKSELYLREIRDCPKNMTIPQSHNGNMNTHDKIEDTFILPAVEYGKRSKKEYISDEISISMSDWMKFLGIFFTDGNVDYSEKRGSYKVSIYQAKADHFDLIENLLDRLPFSFKRKESKKEWYTCSKQLAFWLHQYGQKNNRRIPPFIQYLSRDLKQTFVEWLWIGDGHKSKKNFYLAIASPEFLNSLCPILTDIGYSYSISVKSKQKDKIYNNKLIKSNYPLYLVNVKKANCYHLAARNRNISTSLYKGKVYCVEVPNHTLLVERNGKITWCGNSYQSPSNPIIRRNHEYVLVWSKDNYKLEGDKEKIDITDKEFQQWTMSMWFIQPETRKLGKHLVPYPEELVRRLIKLYCYKDDIVLDPFVGTGTTAVVAKKLNRKYIGIDNDIDSVNYARKRIACSVDIFS